MRMIILALVVVLPLMFVVWTTIGYRARLRRNQALSLRSLGLSATTVNRYRVCREPELHDRRRS